jgi:hypothetical protein
MADSIALQIQKAVVDRLEVASVEIDGATKTPPSNLSVQRERVGPIMPKHVRSGPLVIVHMGGQQPTERSHYKSPALKRVLNLTISVAANADETLSSDAVDPATSWVIQALQSEPTLDGLCHWISEEGQEDFYTMYDDSAEVVSMRELKIQIHFHTRTDNPEARS